MAPRRSDEEGARAQQLGLHGTRGRQWFGVGPQHRCSSLQGASAQMFGLAQLRKQLHPPSLLPPTDRVLGQARKIGLIWQHHLPITHSLCLPTLVGHVGRREE